MATPVAAAPASLPDAAPPSAAAIAVRCRRPAIGVAAVVVGAFISSLNSRITTVGLADIRGGMGFGFDEGSWVATVFSAAQMVVTPAAAWLGPVIGTRRFLLSSSLVFTLASLLVPLTRDYDTVIALQIVRGLSVGTFIPAALGFILRSLAPRWWIWGVAAYAFRFVFSQNITSSVESWYADAGAWQWIFWQNVVLTLIMILLIAIGAPRQPVNRELLRQTDWGGIVLAGLGFGLLYAALDQGNRLDWLNSGVVVGLLLAGGLLLLAFCVQETVIERPLIHWRALIERNVWIPATLISIYGFGSTATSFILPDYLTRVQGLRSLQIGDALNWIALPQLVIVPIVAALLRHIDARLLLAIGLALIALGSWLDTGLTHDWAGGDFLPSLMVEAVGLAFALTALIVFAVANITPAQAASIAALIQIARLFGNEVGSAFVQTFVRVREQTYSNLIGLHLTVGSGRVERAVTQFSAPFDARPTGSGDVVSQGLATIANLVQRESYVLAYIDGFWIVAWVLTAGLLLVLLLRPPPPNPLTPPRID
jgi:DHA2 family multidrug resistance protein